MKSSFLNLGAPTKKQHTPQQRTSAAMLAYSGIHAGRRMDS